MTLISIKSCIITHLNISCSCLSQSNTSLHTVSHRSSLASPTLFLLVFGAGAKEKGLVKLMYTTCATAHVSNMTSEFNNLHANSLKTSQVSKMQLSPTVPSREACLANYISNAHDYFKQSDWHAAIAVCAIAQVVYVSFTRPFSFSPAPNIRRKRVGEGRLPDLVV